MFGLTKTKLPITPDEKLWVDRSFTRLASLLGADRALSARVLLPTPEYFPDRYDGSEIALSKMFHRVAAAMQVDSESIEVTLFRSEDHVNRELMPYSSGNSHGAGGLYIHDPIGRAKISVSEEKLKDPLALVAILAHEIGHLILLRPGLVDRTEKDMEPLNDLLTVFLGMGIFTANAAFRFQQYTDFEKQGWSTKRLGYLSEEIFAYSLARFAYERREDKPAWASHIAPNVRGYYKRSLLWLRENKEPYLLDSSKSL